MAIRMVPVDLLFTRPADSSRIGGSSVASSVNVPSTAVTSLSQRARRTRVIECLRLRNLCGMPTVVGIDRDRLIVGEGIDACCLAKWLGRRWIRARMSGEVLEQWDGRSVLALDAAVRDSGRTGFYTPVYHEKYRKAVVGRPDSVRLDLIRRLLGPLGEGCRCLDIGCNMGGMSHHLQRQGFQVTAIDYDDEHLAVARALNETYGLDVQFVKTYFGNFNTSEEYDVTLALTVLYHVFYRQEEQHVPLSSRVHAKEAMEKIDRLTRHALIWESGPDPAAEISLIRSHSGLTEYCSLGRTKGTGKRREMGVFLRPGTQVSHFVRSQYESEFGGHKDGSHGE